MRLSMLLAAMLPAAVHSLSTTDMLQDADVSQSGYLPNHNIDPTKLSSYTMAYTKTYNTAEVFYAKPLVWTPPGGTSEYVILVSNQNIVRVLDTTGTTIYTRTLDPPFLSADSQCGDVPNTIGVIGTPIIDSATDIMYFYSKGYKNGASSGGTINGQYKLYAVKLPTLADVAGFPRSLEGIAASNDNTRYFVGGTVLQRPGLAFVGNSIVAGFGGQCDNFNYTGLLVSASKTTGAVTNMQAMVARPGAPSPQPTDIQDQTGGKAGIWQSGMGLAVDSAKNRVYFVTGNGRGPGDLKGSAGVATPGTTKISTLEQTVARFSVDGSGLLTQEDWFCPVEYDNLNGSDGDFGSSGVALLDPATFSGGGVQRIAVATGKNGKVYIMDADSLGGFRMGTGGTTDGVIQTLDYTGASFFGGIGSYPGGGGYIYFIPTNGNLYAYKYSIQNGKPNFALAGKSALTFAGKCVPTVTDLNGQAGTGVVWVSDVNQGLLAYNAIPVNGVLQLYTTPATGRLSKFQRPAFGNTRVYTTSQNKLFAIAPPGTPPPPPTVSSVSSTAPATSSSKSSTSSSTSKSSTLSSSSVITSTSKLSSSSSSSSSSTLSSSSSRISSSSSSSKPASSSSSSVVSTKSSSSSVISSSTSKTSSSTTLVTSTSKSTSSSSVVPSSSKTSSVASSSTSSIPIYAPTIPAGKLKTYNWHITWVRAAPDGFARPFIGINGQWPCPALEVNLGDEIKINVWNDLGNETTAIHFHGLFQKNTTYEDGPAMVTQCPIPPGETFVYQFKVLQAGTYWYHAHVGGQYIDGFRGPLIIKDTQAPYKVDQEVTLTLSDLYHDEAPYLINYFLSSDNTDTTGGAEPVPNSALMNEAQNVQFSITPGKKYLFRIINMGAIGAHYLQFDQHTMTIVEVDGVFVQPYDVQQLFVGVAQRYSVVIQAKADASQNYAIVASMDSDMFASYLMPPGMNTNVTGWLVYDAAKALPAPPSLQIQPFDDSVLIPADQVPLMDPPSQTIYLTASFGANEAGSTRGLFNGVTYVPQKVPTLYTALTAPANVLNDPTIYGTNSIPFVLPYNSIIQLSINNHDDRAHPFHLHGHNFQVVTRGSGGSNFPGLFDARPLPMRRDTLVIYAESSAVIRFRADSPGINLFHCHTEWHVESGLTVTFIEAPTELQAMKPYIPVSHRDVCDKHGILRKGNAAGNSKNWQDLTGANTEPPASEWGALVNPPTSR